MAKKLFIVVGILGILLSTASFAAVVRHGNARVIAGPVEVMGAEGSIVLQATSATELRNVSLRAGDPVFAGELIKSGAVANSGLAAVRLRLAGGGELTVNPGETVTVSPDATVALGANTCSVSCGAGFFACCTNPGIFSSAKCVCVANGKAATCDSGGPGSASCSVGAVATEPEPIDQPVDQTPTRVN